MGSEALAAPSHRTVNRTPRETEALDRWPELRPFVREVVARYGDRLHAILLYGSRARGDAREDSDYDVAIVLDGPFDRRAVKDWLFKRTFALRFPDAPRAFGPDIQAMPIDAERVRSPVTQDFFARNVAIDGLPLARRAR